MCKHDLDFFYLSVSSSWSDYVPKYSPQCAIDRN